MWEVMSYGERPYWDMSNQDVSYSCICEHEVTFTKTLKMFLDMERSGEGGKAAKIHTAA